MWEIEKNVLEIGVQKIEALSRSQEQLESVKDIIYKILTQRLGFQEKISQNKNFLYENFEKFQPYQEFYNKKIEYFSEIFPISDNPAWFQFNVAKNFPKTDINFKVYKTINPFELWFLEHLEELFSEFQKVSQKYQCNISFKIPRKFSGLYAGSDNIVVHFSDSDAIGEVQNILIKWSERNNVNFLKRDFSRTEIAADHNNTSFSDYVAHYYAIKWLEWYSAQSVVLGAIETSKIPNFKT